MQCLFMHLNADVRSVTVIIRHACPITFETNRIMVQTVQFQQQKVKHQISVFIRVLINSIINTRCEK